MLAHKNYQDLVKEVTVVTNRMLLLKQEIDRLKDNYGPVDPKWSARIGVIQGGLEELLDTLRSVKNG
jgi:hypothetical protein